MIDSSQGMETCNPEGRSCIEKNFAGTFDCNMTCDGIFADVQWVDEQMEEPEEHKQVEVKFKNIDEEEFFAKLMKRMQRMKATSDNKGEELDKVKFQKMISEYKKFKMNSVKPLKFNSATSSAKFGQF